MAVGAPWVVLADAVVVVLSYVAKESGEVLQARLSQVDPASPRQHGELGALRGISRWGCWWLQSSSG